MNHRPKGDGLDPIRSNPYPGRGIIIGMEDSGEHLVQACWIMGRSKNSRNRIFECEETHGRLYTSPVDLSEVTDPSRIIYDAMNEYRGHFVVSNGDQTGTVIGSLKGRKRGKKVLYEALHFRAYEIDVHNTPRIVAVCNLDPQFPMGEMAILKKSPWTDFPDRFFYSYAMLAVGHGVCLTTYVEAEDDGPLPSFQGDPFTVRLRGDIETISKTLWSVLDKENRISLAVKFINRRSRSSTIVIKNKYKKIKS